MPGLIIFGLAGDTKSRLRMQALPPARGMRPAGVNREFRPMIKTGAAEFFLLYAVKAAGINGASLRFFCGNFPRESGNC
jgi:hypothetical protein